MSSHPLRVVCVAGPSDSGKTSLVEALVPKLAEYGRVGTVKSIHHDIEVDTEGADTHRHRTAGADAVVGVTPTLTFEFAPGGKQAPPPDPDAGWLFDHEPADEAATDTGRTDDDRLARERRVLEATLARFRRREFDYVLVEGFTDAPLPTIVVGDRAPSAVGGDVIGHSADGPDALAEQIRGLEPVGTQD